MDDTVDLLKIKIEKAKMALSTETLNAIAAVNWKIIILEMRDKHGYSFEQLGDLELETELVLCGLLRPSDYLKELEHRMKLSHLAAKQLVDEMNELVFKKIREELIKNTERKKIFEKAEQSKKSSAEEDLHILNQAGIKIVDRHAPPKEEKKEILPTPSTLPIPEKLELEEAIPSQKENIPKEEPLPKIENPTSREETQDILDQKLSGTFQVPTVKTEHTLENIIKTNPVVAVVGKSKIPSVDPYREVPE